MIAESTIMQEAARSFGPREQMPRPARVRRPPAARVALLHGAYLVAAGGRSLARFKWTGACLANVGAALVASGARGKVSRELRILGAGIGLTLAALDLRDHRTIEGIAQLAFAVLWGAAEIKEVNAARRPPEPAFA